MAEQDQNTKSVIGHTDHFGILERYGIRAKKSLGQYFLVQDGILGKIARAVDIRGKKVLEIGPGYGALTEKLLAGDPSELTLVELDPMMVQILKDRKKRSEIILPEWVVYTVLEQDVLTYIPTEPRVVIANIPYYITSPILFHFLYAVEHRPTDMVILMQREVADKIRATPKYGNSYLSLACENATLEIREIMRVAPVNFVPAPKVESSVLYLRVNPTRWAEDTEFLALLRLGFVQPRKKLSSNLASTGRYTKSQIEEVFEDLHLESGVRAEQLSLSIWRELYSKIREHRVRE